MNNRFETPYRLKRPGFGVVIVGWERVYELTPLGLMDKVKGFSFQYDKAISVSFPEYWKSDKEAYLPSLILNNIFGIVPYFDSHENLTWVRVVNLATNEPIKDYAGTEKDLLYICKHILTDCKKVLRSWGKEPYRELRYGMEWLRDPWHKKNYPDAFQRPDVRIYDIIKYNRLSEKECFRKACWLAKRISAKNTAFDHYDFHSPKEVNNRIWSVMLRRINDYVQDNKPEDFDIEMDDLGRAFDYLFDKECLYNVYRHLGMETHNNYLVKTYINLVAQAALSDLQ